MMDKIDVAVVFFVVLMVTAIVSTLVLVKERVQQYAQICQEQGMTYTTWAKGRRYNPATKVWQTIYDHVCVDDKGVMFVIQGE